MQNSLTLLFACVHLVKEEDENSTKESYDI